MALRKSPLHRFSKHNAAAKGSTNPFDSEYELDTKQPLKTHGKKSSEPSSDLNTNPFEDGESNYTLTSSQKYNALASRSRYKNDFRDSGGLENQTVEELEHYAAYKAEETTKTVNSCLRIAEDIREDATKTLFTLHQQGEQLTRTHVAASDIDQDLSRGEKLLGSLGGIFSKTWKPKKTRTITGPVIMRDDLVHRKGNHLEQRERLGLTSSASREQHTCTPPPEPTNALQKVEVEKQKQDYAFSDLSNILGELKEMALDMGSEIDKQNEAVDHFQDDVEELNFRVKGANQRTHRLLGK